MLPPFFETHECTAFCRAPRHAEVMWVQRDLAEPPIENLHVFCRAIGARFIHAEPAPEARPKGGVAQSLDLDTQEILGVRVDPKTDDPWLLVWEPE